MPFFIYSFILWLSIFSSKPMAAEIAPFVEVLSSGKNLYLGELHGTVEVPQLVREIVDATLVTSTLPVAVSLELPLAAKNGESPFWEGTDGRSSQAMYALVQYLLALEILVIFLALVFGALLGTKKPKYRCYRCILLFF